MPRNHRLSRADFARIERSRGKRIHGKYFSLLVAPLPNDSVKFACVVSKKFSAKAVVRNRIERQTREAVRPLMKSAVKGVAFIVYPKREALGAKFSEISRDIENLLSQV